MSNDLNLRFNERKILYTKEWIHERVDEKEQILKVREILLAAVGLFDI